jgi:Protein of unknown function (DUF2442)
MNSPKHGIPSSGVEITNISSHGLWLLTNENEYFLAYDHFPWFKNARVDEVLNVKEIKPGHFHWPDLEVDLSVEIIEHPEKYPLQAR